jgi:hypothetical protein
MNGYLDSFLAAKPVEAREVKLSGGTATVYFRHLTAGDKVELLKGKKYKVGQTAEAVEVDLGEFVEDRMRFVAYAVANADGSRVFKAVSDVARLAEADVGALYDAAKSVNEGVEPGEG